MKQTRLTLLLTVLLSMVGMTVLAEESGNETITADYDDTLPAADYKRVLTAEETLISGDILNAIAEQAANDGKTAYGVTLGIPAGATIDLHSESESGNSNLKIPEGMSITFFGMAGGDAPTIKFQKNIDMEGTHGYIAFENVNVVNDGANYFVNQSKACNVGEFSIKDSEVSGFSTAFFRLQGTDVKVISKLVLDNSIFHDMCTGYSFIHVDAGSGNGVVNNIDIDNSTLYNIATGGKMFIYSKNTNMESISVSNTTFYNCIGNNNYWVDFGSVDYGCSSVFEFVKCLFTKTPDDVTKHNRASNTIYFNDCWKTADFFKNFDCNAYESTAEDIFTDPTHGDFTLKITDKVGDPRWRIENNNEPYAILTDNNTVLKFYYDNQKAVRNGMSIGPFSRYDESGWYAQRESIKTVEFDQSFANCSSITSTAWWFTDCPNLTSISGLDMLNTENVTVMTQMFSYCSNLTSINLSKFNTQNVTDMSYLFYGCSSLTSLDVSNFNTQNVRNMREMFRECSGLTSLNLSNFDTQNVTNMSEMFKGCSGLTSLDVSSFDTQNVTNMSDMFFGCSGLSTLNVSKFNTQNVTNMGWMFYGCSSLTALDVSKFDTQNVTNMMSMFEGCSGLTTLDVSRFNTTNVTSMGIMFLGCKGLTSLDVSRFNTTNVTGMGFMFNGCSGLTSLDLSNFDTQKVTNMEGMFFDCSNLTTIYTGSQWTTAAITEADNGKDMFTNCTSLVGGASTTYDASHVDYSYAHIDGGESNPGYFTDKNAPVVTAEPYIVLNDDNTVLKFYYDDQREAQGGMSIGNGVSVPWTSYAEEITTVVFDPSFANCTTITSTRRWFYGCSSLTTITDLKYLNTEKITDISSMFEGCSNLTSLDVSNFNTQNVTDMGWMFSKCSGLTSLDVSKFDTQNVTDMSYMFYNCSGLTSIDVNNFNTQNVTNMRYMFSGCSGLTSLDLRNFNTQNVTSMECMFMNCSSLISLDVSKFDTQKVTSMFTMFRDCSSLTSLDVSSLNTQNVTNMMWMFMGCSSLTSLDLRSFNTQNVTNMHSMFSGCSGLTSLNVSSFNTQNVTDMLHMFYNCSSLTSLDLSMFSTHNVTGMTHMFYGCSSLTSLNVSKFDTQNVNSLYYMFYGCSSLTNLDLSSFDTSNVTIFDHMFDGCSSLTSLFLGKAKIANIEFKRIKNPNLLVYVTDAAAAPATVTNVVINGVAEKIVLTDVTEGNNNFNCPQQFTAQSISYTHNYKQYTKPDICQGWETIALPFTVKDITHEKNGKITPFGVDGGKPFWLKQMTDNGVVNSDSIRANMPYLICMPSSKFYSEDYRLNGKVTFSATKCVVPVTNPQRVSGGDKTFVPAFQRVEKQSGVYAVNVNEPYGEYPEGSIFVQDYRDVRPFEAYTEHAVGSREFFCIEELLEETTSLREIKNEELRIKSCYNLNGQRVEHPRKGLYIVNGRKVVIK